VLGLLELLDGGVVGGDIGVVVLGVVELHDLAADGGLERAVVVCELRSALVLHPANAPEIADVQDRSGRVALPRVKVVPPMEARMEGAERTAERSALERKRAAAIVSVCVCVVGIAWYCSLRGVVGKKRSSVSIRKLKSSRNGGDVMLAHNIGVGIGVLQEIEYTPLQSTTTKTIIHHRALLTVAASCEERLDTSIFIHQASNGINIPGGPLVELISRNSLTTSLTREVS
jgi:hypothetical protein